MITDEQIQDPLSDEEIEQQRLSRLSGFAASIEDKLKDAIKYRQESGIEDRWLEAEEFFAGIDDANRGTKMLKPATSDGRVTVEKSATTGRSTVFINITAPYVKMGKSRASEMLLPSEDKPFSIDPSPMPDIVELKNSKDLMPGGQHNVSDVATAFIDEAKKKAEIAETQIWDWLSESKWHTEMRKVIGQCAKIGTGVLKGPVPTMRKYRKANKMEDGTLALVIQEKLSPESCWVDAWDIFPDPACGSNIHDGSYLFQRRLVSGKKLRELKKQKGYIASVIDQVLLEGPSTTKKVNSKDQASSIRDKTRYELFYYYGEASAEEYQSARPEHDECGEMLNVICVMVNGKIIKASLNPLDSGEFPYDVIVWEPIEDFWAGVGIADQANEPQRIVNAAVRNMMDNAGVSAGPQIVIDRAAIEPADGVWSITPLKIWYKTDDSEVDDVRKAIMSIVIPSMQVELNNILKMGLDLAEKATNMPLIMQGQQGSATETVGGMEILQANASSVLRDIARVFDDSLIKPHVTRYYEWLMMYGEDENAKGDFVIQPQGSTAFYERDAQNQFILKLEPLAQDKGYGLNKRKIMQELLKANKISPARVTYTDAEMEQQAAAEAKNPPMEPTVQAAKIRADADLQKAGLEQELEKSQADIKEKEFQSEAALKISLAEKEHENRMALAQLQKEVKMMELAQAQGVSLDSIKADLAQTTMKLNVQKELSFADKQHELTTQAKDHLHQRLSQAITPPTEPVGRAKDGEAFEA